MTIVIDIQKSNYSNCYYINYGFCVKEINGVKNPNISDCDIMGRFTNYMDNQIEYDFKLEKLEQEQLAISLNKNICNIITPVKESGIHKYFELYPEALKTARSNLKKFIEFL